MRITRSGAVMRELERIFGGQTVAGLKDEQLLERFVTKNDDAAFEALVRRYGPVVLGVCRRTLHDPNDVEDAFQATFLVFVRKAHTIRYGEQLGNWLHGVAHRVAVRSRANSAKRHAREVLDADEPAAPTVSPSANDEAAEVRQAIDEEIDQLPNKLRDVVMLCYLQGRTHDQAASELGCPVGTVRSRLSRARELLQARLTRRGLAPTVGMIGTILGTSPTSAAVVPLILVEKSVRAAMSFAAGSKFTASAASATAAALASEFLWSATMTKLKFTSAVLLSTSLLAGGTAATAYHTSGGDLLAPVTAAIGFLTPGTEINAPVPDLQEQVKDEQERINIQVQLGSLKIMKAQLDHLRHTYDGLRKGLHNLGVEGLPEPLEADSVPQLEGAIIAVNGEQVTISIGSEAGLEPRQQLFVVSSTKVDLGMVVSSTKVDLGMEDHWDAYEYVGKIVIEDVKPEEAQGRITEQPGRAPRVGDQVQRFLDAQAIRFAFGPPTPPAEEEQEPEEAQAEPENGEPPAPAEEIAGDVGGQPRGTGIPGGGGIGGGFGGAGAGDDRPGHKGYTTYNNEIIAVMAPDGKTLWGVSARTGASAGYPIPPGIQARPVLGQSNLLTLQYGDKGELAELAVFSPDHGKWSVQPLVEPVKLEEVARPDPRFPEGYDGRFGPFPEEHGPKLAPSSVGNLVSYTIAGHVYAYSGAADRWDVLELPDGPIEGPSVRQGAVTVSTVDRLYVFPEQTGEWKTIEINPEPQP